MQKVNPSSYINDVDNEDQHFESHELYVTLKNDCCKIFGARGDSKATILPLFLNLVGQPMIDYVDL